MKENWGLEPCLALMTISIWGPCAATNAAVFSIISFTFTVPGMSMPTGTFKSHTPPPSLTLP